MHATTPVGARVRPSDKYPRRGKRKSLDLMAGTIKGESHDRRCWVVLWDGLVTNVTIHKSFVTIEEAPR